MLKKYEFKILKPLYRLTFIFDPLLRINIKYYKQFRCLKQCIYIHTYIYIYRQLSVMDFGCPINKALQYENLERISELESIMAHLC